MIFVIFIFLKKFSPRKRRFRTQGQENGWILKRLRYNRLVAALTMKMLVRIIPFIKHNRLNPYVLKAETFSTYWKKSAKKHDSKTCSYNGDLPTKMKDGIKIPKNGDLPTCLLICIYQTFTNFTDKSYPKLK